MTIATLTSEAANGLQPEFARAGVEVPGLTTGGRAADRTATLSPFACSTTGAANGWRGALTRAIVDDPSSGALHALAGQEGPAMGTKGSTNAPTRLWLRHSLCLPSANPSSGRPDRAACEQTSIGDDKSHARDRERHGTGGPKRRREAAISALNSGSGATWGSANGMPSTVVVPVSSEAPQRLVMDPRESSGHGDVMDPLTTSMQPIQQGILAPPAAVPIFQEGGNLADPADFAKVAVAPGEISKSAAADAVKPGSSEKSLNFGPAQWVGEPAEGQMLYSGTPLDGNAPAPSSPGQNASAPYPTSRGGSKSSPVAPGQQIAVGPAQEALRNGTDTTVQLRTPKRSLSHPAAKEATTARTLRSTQGSGASNAPTNWGGAQHATAAEKAPASAVPAALPAAQAVSSVASSRAGQQDNPGRSSVTEQTFTALDTANSKTGFTWSHLSARQAEAGYQDPVLGWVNVRAQSDSSGIHAALVPGSSAAEQSLRGHLDGLQAFLHSQQTSVLTVQVSKPEAFAMGQGSGHGQGQNSGQGPTQNSAEGGGTGTGQGAEVGGRRTSMIARGAGNVPDSHRGIDGTAVLAASKARFPGGNHVSVIA